MAPTFNRMVSTRNIPIGYLEGCLQFWLFNYQKPSDKQERVHRRPNEMMKGLLLPDL